MITIDPSDAIPLWKQIEEEIRRLVATGALHPDDPVPSVRELARTIRVNPATVSKAYQSLVDEGLLTVRRGEGTFVNAQPAPARKSERRAALRPAAIRYASLASTLGATSVEARGEIERALERVRITETES